jgi:hypothetical protein
MKYVKILGLLAVAAAAFMAMAATASATILTSPTGTTYTSKIVAEAEHPPGVTLHGSFTSVNCTNSLVEGNVEKHGAGVTAGGIVSKLTFTNCNFPVKVLKNGSLEIHPINCNAAKYCTGTLTSTGAEVTIETSIASCIFATASTDLGTLTGTDDTKGHATLDISAEIPRTGHSFFCGSKGIWTGSYTVKTPSSLWINA